MTPKISVIMSVFNEEKYLEGSIQSILNQTFTDFEFIITNDASTDSSYRILRKYAELDNRIIIIDNQKNLGLTKSLNKMIDMSKGQYIARMDADDIALEDRLKEQISIFNKNPKIDLIFSDTILIDSNSEIICKSWRPKEIKKIKKYIELNNFIPHPTVMVKKEILEHNKYNETYVTGQDAELWIRLRDQGVNFHYLKKELLYYRISPNSVRKNNENYFYILAKRCINNKDKMAAIKYFSKLSTIEKIKISIKLFIPFKAMFYRGLILKKLKQEVPNG